LPLPSCSALLSLLLPPSLFFDSLQVVTASRRFTEAGEMHRSRSSTNSSFSGPALARSEAELERKVGELSDDSDFYQTADEEEMKSEIMAAKEKMMGKDHKRGDDIEGIKREDADGGL
jgi:hypothetical protein